MHVLKNNSILNIHIIDISIYNINILILSIDS